MGRDWTASDVIAGVSDGGDGRFGDAGDELIPGGDDSRIERIVIGGKLRGSDSDKADSVFESHEIGEFAGGGVRTALHQGPANDTATAILKEGGKFILREL